MTYYNQHNYANVPYPSPSLPSATVKSGGCGVCCGSTALSFFGVTDAQGRDLYPPDKLAALYISRGARVSGGTDMRRAVQILCELGGLECVQSSSEAELAAHLKNGGMAIANVDGDEGAKGVFSSGGHYICVVGAKPNGDLVVFDVGDYSTKYNDPYRASRVKREGKLLICTQATLDMDTKHRTPNYYLLNKKATEKQQEKEDFGMVYKKLEDVPSWGKPTVQKLVNKGALRGDDKGELNIPHEILRVYVVNDRMGLYGA